MCTLHCYVSAAVQGGEEVRASSRLQQSKEETKKMIACAVYILHCAHIQTVDCAHIHTVHCARIRPVHCARICCQGRSPSPLTARHGFEERLTSFLFLRCLQTPHKYSNEINKFANIKKYTNTRNQNPMQKYYK